MTTTAPASQSPERVAQAHKANAPKSSPTSAQSPQPMANTFAALLMQADSVEETTDLSLSPAADQTTALFNRSDASADEADENLSPGQLALLGLMNWQNFVKPTPAANATQGDAGSPLAAAATSSLGLVDPALNTAALPASTGLIASATPSLDAGLRTPLGGPIAQTSLTPTDEAVPAELLAALRAASPDAADTSTAANMPAKAGAAVGLVDPPGAKPRPGTLRHALSTSQATAGVSATSPSTVSLALKSASAETPASITPGQGTTIGKAAPMAQATDAATSTKDSSAQPTDQSSTPAPELRTQELSGAHLGHVFSAGMESPGLDANAAQPPDMPPALTPDNMEQTMDQLGAHISYWAAQGSQRASLTIGDNQNNPLGVNISFANGEVHVHFETDQVDVKAALSLSAEHMLNHMLEARGMTLGDVSIGTNPGEQRASGQANPDTQGQNPTQSNSPGGNRASDRAPSDALPTARANRPATVISANKLDFFA